MLGWMLRNGPFQPLMMGRAKKVWSWSKEEGRAGSWATRQYQNKITFTFSIKQKHFHFLSSKVFSNTCIGNSYSKQGQGKKSNTSNDWTIAVQNICKDEYGPRVMAAADN